MKTTIVCGMLGAGKTSFLRNRLADSSEKAVVLVNDFGKAGIDGDILSADGIESIELPSGCVCCTLKFDLISSLRKVIGEMKPDHLYVEPSGVASPSAVIESLDCLGISPYTVVGIVDATEFRELYESDMYGRFFLDQVTVADLLLVNKTDLAGTEETGRTVALIGEMNPRALIFRTVHAHLTGPFPDILPQNERPQSRGGHLRFENASFAVSPDMPRSRIEALFRDLTLGTFGHVVRAKALIVAEEGPLRCDISSGRIDILPFSRAVGSGRLVVIGHDLKQDELAAALAAASSS